MRSLPRLLALVLICLAGSASAQWQTTTYTLKGGWNSIYLSGDVLQNTIDQLFPTQVVEVWRWNSNPGQVQFTESPLTPSAGTPEWSVWRRGLPEQSTFSTLTGQSAYLVKCTGSTATTYLAPIKQSPLMPKAAWVRNGANLLGFPSRPNGSSYPTFANYFAQFPAVLATNLKIYKYVGGDLGGANPLQVFSPAVEPLDRTKAYWFSAEVGGDFYAPVEFTPRGSGGLEFGRTGTSVTVLVRNRTPAALTLTMTPVASESAPPGQTAIAGSVPLTRRTFTSTGTWTETPLTGPSVQVIPANGTVELSFGINRAALGGATNSLSASFLKVTDGNLMEVFVPTTATKASLEGLWLGDVSITHVSNKVSNGASASASFSGRAVTAITVLGGGFGYPGAPQVTIEAPVTGTAATATATVVNGAVTAITLTGGGSGYTRTPKVTIARPPPLTGTSVPETSRFRLRTLLHVTEGGTATLLPKVFIGQLAAAPHDVGICTVESLLKQDAKASAHRFVAAHLPYGAGPIAASGSVQLPGALSCAVTVGFNDPSNPFVHQYHPDHDNRNARGDDLPPGVESPNISRTCTFQFTASPPSGSTASGWGTSVIGGTYVETITGVHKDPLQVNGTFELRRASEIGTLHQ